MAILCSRHPDRQAQWLVVSHFIADDIATAVASEQVLNAMCRECRMDLLRWGSQKAKK